MFLSDVAGPKDDVHDSVVVFHLAAAPIRDRAAAPVRLSLRPRTAAACPARPAALSPLPRAGCGTAHALALLGAGDLELCYTMRAFVVFSIFARSLQ